jgi:hypothetical protein
MIDIILTAQTLALLFGVYFIVFGVDAVKRGLFPPGPKP